MTQKKRTATMVRRMADLTYQLLENSREKLESIAEGLDLSLSEFKCLRAFRNDLDLSVKEIVRRMDLSSSRLTRIIDGLVGKKMMTRDFDSSDRRSIRVSLTAKGKEVTKKLNAGYLSIHRQILQHIPEKSRADVIRALDDLSQAMSAWKKE